MFTPHLKDTGLARAAEAGRLIPAPPSILPAWQAPHELEGTVLRPGAVRSVLPPPGSLPTNQPILKKINPEYSIGRADAEAEALVLWPLNAKSQLTGKDPDAGKD